jgi:uncharacterized membrane protein
MEFLFSYFCKKNIMNQNNQNLDKYIKTNTVIFLSVLIGQVFLLVAASYLVNKNAYFKTFSFSYNNTILYISGIATFLFMIASYAIFKRNLKSINTLENIDDKLTQYKQALILRYFLVEIPTIYSLIMFVFTKDRLYALYAIILLFYMLRSKPTKENLLIDLKLTENEISGSDNN